MVRQFSAPLRSTPRLQYRTCLYRPTRLYRIQGMQEQTDRIEMPYCKKCMRNFRHYILVLIRVKSRHSRHQPSQQGSSHHYNHSNRVINSSTSSFYSSNSSTLAQADLRRDTFKHLRPLGHNNLYRRHSKCLPCLPAQAIPLWARLRILNNSYHHYSTNKCQGSKQWLRITCRLANLRVVA